MNYTKVYTFLLCLIIFLVPSNLFLKFFESSAYVNGIFVDYLIPKLYLSDIPIILLLLTWGYKTLMAKKKPLAMAQLDSTTWGVIGLGVLLIIRQFFAPYPLAAIWYLLKLIEMIALGFFLVHHRQLLTKRPVLLSIVVTLIFQSFLAIYQYISHSALFGYWFLGEPNLSNPIGLARLTIGGIEKVLPYGTTAHPNILGGTLAIYFLILLKTLKKPKMLVVASFSLIGLLLTFSFSAWLTLILGMIFWILYKYVNLLYPMRYIFFLIAFFTPLAIKHLAVVYSDSPSMVRRAYLQEAAVNMYIDNPLFGIGLNNFTAKVEEYTATREIVRFIQPVHNIFFLWIAETGIAGAFLLIGVCILIIRKRNSLQLPLRTSRFLLFSAVPIMVLDHYLLTQQTGLLLLVFLIGFNQER
ncbi:MAG TPA: O-antigen ligase family protein [Patescibacteria group bacterium]